MNPVAFRSRYPSLRVEDLEGYAHDSLSHRAFTRRYLPINLAGLALVATPFVRLGVLAVAPSPWEMAPFVAGIAVLLGALRHMYLSQPPHVPSGRLMKRYRNASVEDELEVLYVDRLSRSFFRVSYQVRDR